MCEFVAVLVDDVRAITKTLESDDGGPIEIKKQEPATDASPETCSQTNDDTVSRQSETTSQNSQHSSENFAENEEEEEDLDDFDRTESDFENEIERELNAMESTLPKSKLELLPLTPEESVPEVKVDWSDIAARDSSQATPTAHDMTSSSHQKGVLKLKGSVKPKDKQKQSPPPDEGWGDDWDAPGSSPSHSQPTAVTSTKKSVVSTANTKVSKSSARTSKAAALSTSRGPPKVRDDLSGLDIKSLDDKKFKGLASSEFDFFVDMTPSLKTSSAKQQAPADLLQVLSVSKTADKT